MDAYEAARTGCVLFDVSGRGHIQVEGTEAIVFIHNLATNDVKRLAPGEWCETFFCTATAKVIAYGRIWRDTRHDILWLDLDPGHAEKLYAHLDRHLISEDVQLTDRSPGLATLHLAGPRAAEVLSAAHFAQRQPIMPLGVPGFHVHCHEEQLAIHREMLMDAGASEGDAATYDVLRVEAGTPVYGVDLDDTTFAPEVGRTAQAISYAKGCYLGQEPIVMARDRGIVQRGLVGLTLAGDPVPPGSKVYHQDKEVGRVTSCVRSPRLGTIALAYVRRPQQTPGTAVEVGDDRVKATVGPLPFPG